MAGMLFVTAVFAMLVGFGALVIGPVQRLRLHGRQKDRSVTGPLPQREPRRGTPGRGAAH